MLNRLAEQATLHEVGQFLVRNGLYLGSLREDGGRWHAYVCREATGRGRDAWGTSPQTALNRAMDALGIPLESP